MRVSTLQLLEVGLCLEDHRFEKLHSSGKATAVCQWDHWGLESLSCHWEVKGSKGQQWREQERQATPFFHSHFYPMFWANKFSSRQCYFNCWKQVQYSLIQGHPKNEKGIETNAKESVFRYVCCAKTGEKCKWVSGTAEMSLFLHTPF